MYGLKVDDPKLGFNASHFLVGHIKCSRLHGHNYRIMVELEGDLEESRMVMDFRDIMGIVKQICDRFDHRVLVPTRSNSIRVIEERGMIEIKTLEKSYSFPKDECFLLPTKSSTAEDIARFIFEQINDQIPLIKKVFVSEVEGAAAFYGV